MENVNESYRQEFVLKSYLFDSNLISFKESIADLRAYFGLGQGQST